MDRQWDRAHDRVLAEKCEGMEVKVKDAYHFISIPGPPVTLSRLPSYEIDVAATIRAAEAWRKQEPDNRNWEMGTTGPPDHSFVANVFTGHKDGPFFDGSADSPAEALAWALYDAVKGD